MYFNSTQIFKSIKNTYMSIKASVALSVRKSCLILKYTSMNQVETTNYERIYKQKDQKLSLKFKNNPAECDTNQINEVKCFRISILT